MYWRVGPRYHDRPRTENKCARRQLADSRPPPGLLAKKGKLRWSDAPAAGLPAAGSYLRLLARPGSVEELASVLSQVPTVTQAAKDILRAAGFPLQIADGYHRVCASYHLNEDTEIPCRIADIPAAAG